MSRLKEINSELEIQQVSSSPEILIDRQIIESWNSVQKQLSAVERPTTPVVINGKAKVREQNPLEAWAYEIMIKLSAVARLCYCSENEFCVLILLDFFGLAFLGVTHLELVYPYLRTGTTGVYCAGAILKLLLTQGGLENCFPLCNFLIPGKF